MSNIKIADLVETLDIEMLCNDGEWRDVRVRIKPQKKPDVVSHFMATPCNCCYVHGFEGNLRLTFSGDTGELIKAEVIK